MSTIPATQPSDDEATIRPFADFLREHNRGRTHDELSEKLREVVAAVTDTGKAGALTLVLKVTQQKKTLMLEISDDVKTRVPQHSRPASLWFIDKDGNVTRDNPDQLQFASMQAVPTHNNVASIQADQQQKEA